MSLSAEDAVAIESLAADAGFVSEPADGRFHVTLVNFDGPFDLLLSLISRRQLDVTEVALSQVTDEFLTYLKAAGEWDLGQATEFLVVATTLLDLKAARLLPAAEVDDEEDVALLEARDLLFARLLQYRAYKLAASYLSELERGQAPRHGAAPRRSRGRTARASPAQARQAARVRRQGRLPAGPGHQSFQGLAGAPGEGRSGRGQAGADGGARHQTQTARAETVGWALPRPPLHEGPCARAIFVH